MKASKQLVNELIRSLKNESDDWGFDKYTCDNKKWGLSLWTANIPVLNLSIYRPIEMSFSLSDKIRIYILLSKLASVKIIKAKEG